MKKRDIERIEKDKKIDFLLETSEGREQLLEIFQSHCEQSSLVHLLESTLHLEGNIIECGVFRGASIWMTARTLKDKAPEKHIYALDSFEGFPEKQVTDKDTSLFRPVSKLARKFQHANDVPDRIVRVFDAFGIKGKPLVGYFEKTLPLLDDETYCFAHIDSDTYLSHIECLNALYSKVVAGGVIVFDDYKQKNWPGATKAVDEFLASRPEKPQLDSSRKTPAWYIRKV